ncbi:lipid II:glycine glycyltransferase FemX [Halovivax gelatinilyticus]|uniref:lipid II:glycine glycyltransferase FemX n=1 Tax=Halovivax gelatinilyticus TaxID=2961597 RepID=UPI0020CA9713|nr:GNAT family N-acetyltransferase [Halovivax gelatinilyticus]
MSIDIRRFDLATEGAEWNRYVERFDSTNPLFRAEALTRQSRETGTKIVALAGFKGQEAVGIFPIFVLEKGPFSAAFSPAPRSWSCYLGPAMSGLSSLKQRKADRRVQRFLDGSLEWLDEKYGPIYCKFTTAGCDDVRPFVWNEYDVTPGYTYIVDLDATPDELIDRFSGDARRNVRSTPEHVAIAEGGTDDVEAIVRQVAARYESQGRPFQLSPEYVRSLYEALPDGALRPYVCTIDGEFHGGILVLESDTTLLRWQGGVKIDRDVDVAVNDLLDWHVMCEGIERGAERYDLVGAGVPSINRYKAKFNPRLATHYTVTSGAFGLDRLVDRYQKFV